MMFLRKYDMLLNQQGGGDGAGNGQAGAGKSGAENSGGGVLFDGAPGGSGGSPGHSSQPGGTGGQPGANAAGGGVSSGAQGGNTISIPDNWKDSLPEDLKSHASLNLVKDIPTLVKNYINAQKMVGADKISVPNANTSKDEWKQIFSKLGVPEKLDDYKVEVPQDLKVDQEWMKGLSKVAHENGVLPTQAKALVEWMAKEDKAREEKEVSTYMDKVKSELGKLQTEWGQSYGENIARAKAALREFADKATQEAIQKSGLGNNVNLIKLLAKVGETLDEGKIRGEGGGGGFTLTPAQAQAELDKIKNDFKHPYYNAEHPEHKSAKDKVRELYQLISPKKKSG